MAVNHFFINRKGGASKSFCAWVLMQWLLARFGDVRGVDLDPSNQSLSKFGGLGRVDAFQLRAPNGNIDVDKFDAIVQGVLADKSLADDTQIVWDTGSSCAPALLAYVQDEDLFEVIRKRHKVIIHIPVVAGATYYGVCLDELALWSNFGVPILAWLDPVNGELPLASNKKGLLGNSVYTKNESLQNTLLGVVEMSGKSTVRFGARHGRLFERFFNRCLVLDQFDKDPEWVDDDLNAQRLITLRKAIFGPVDASPLPGWLGVA